jgi:hypothetical protein
MRQASEQAADEREVHETDETEDFFHLEILPFLILY